MITEKLKIAYEKFVSKHSFLNKPRNKRIIDRDAWGLVITASLEHRIGDEWVASDILTREEVIEEQYTTTDVKEAMLYVLGMTGKISISNICAIVDMEPDTVIADLSEHILWNPIEECWDTCERVLSGNIIAKIQEVETKLQELYERQRSVA